MICLNSDLLSIMSLLKLMQSTITENARDPAYPVTPMDTLIKTSSFRHHGTDHSPPAGVSPSPKEKLISAYIQHLVRRKLILAKQQSLAQLHNLQERRVAHSHDISTQSNELQRLLPH